MAIEAVGRQVLEKDVVSVETKGSLQGRLWCCAALACVLAVPLTSTSAASAGDAIVGTWIGTAHQPEQDPFDVRLTIVSPKGGISRYPSAPACGGILSGDRKGDGYEYQETITFGGKDERDDGCVGGLMRLTIDGDTMKYDWSGTYEGQDYSSSGELHREGGGKQR